MLDLSFALPRLTRRPQVVASARRQAQAGARAAGNGARLAWSAVRFAREVAPRRPPRVPKARTAPDLAAAALVGAGAEFLLDPADGKRRRKELLDRTRAATRRLGRQASQQASHARGVAAGAVHEATSSATPPAGDQVLADRVRTQIFRPLESAKGAVSIGVVDGVVYIRGEVADPGEIERLVSSAQSVPGVRAVENLMHPPSTRAPMGGRA